MGYSTTKFAFAHRGGCICRFCFYLCCVVLYCSASVCLLCSVFVLFCFWLCIYLFVCLIKVNHGFPDFLSKFVFSHRFLASVHMGTKNPFSWKSYKRNIGTKILVLGKGLRNSRLPEYKTLISSGLGRVQFIWNSPMFSFSDMKSSATQKYTCDALQQNKDRGENNSPVHCDILAFVAYLYLFTTCITSM